MKNNCAFSCVKFDFLKKYYRLKFYFASSTFNLILKFSLTLYIYIYIYIYIYMKTWKVKKENSTRKIKII